MACNWGVWRWRGQPCKARGGKKHGLERWEGVGEGLEAKEVQWLECDAKGGEKGEATSTKLRK